MLAIQHLNAVPGRGDAEYGGSQDGVGGEEVGFLVLMYEI